MPAYVELNDREQSLLTYFYDNKQLFSKTEALELFKEYNSNKYQVSKDKFERAGLIRLMLPPVDREIHSGKNPDYFMVTFGGYYNALINKRFARLKGRMSSGVPMRYRNERYEYLIKDYNPYYEGFFDPIVTSTSDPYKDFHN